METEYDLRNCSEMHGGLAGSPCQLARRWRIGPWRPPWGDDGQGEAVQLLVGTSTHPVLPSPPPPSLIMLLFILFLVLSQVTLRHAPPSSHHTLLRRCHPPPLSSLRSKNVTVPSQQCVTFLFKTLSHSGNGFAHLPTTIHSCGQLFTLSLEASPLPLACPALPRSTAPGCSFTPLPPLPRSSSFLGFCISYFLVFRISLHSLPPKPGSLGFFVFDESQLSNFLFGRILDDH